MKPHCSTLPATHLLTGYVRQSGSGAPVHGILVQITAILGDGWSDASCDVDLGCDLTTADGRFCIVANLDRCASAGLTELHLTLKDRGGRVIAEIRRKLPKCPPCKPSDIVVEVNPDALACHQAIPIAWTAPGGPLVPERALDEIEEAIGIISTPGSTEHARRLLAASAARSALARFPRALEDAWDALKGDLAAGERFRDVLSVICACHAEECCEARSGPFAEVIDAAFAAECEPDPCKPPRVIKPCLGDEEESDAYGTEAPDAKTCGCRTCDPKACPRRLTLIDRDSAATLVMAALHVSCGHEKTARAYVAAILYEICRLRLLAALHEAAVEAACGDKAAAAHLADLLDFVAAKLHVGSHERAPRDWIGAIGCCDDCLDAALADCIADAVCAWKRISCYVVEEIAPARACPGDQIAICGCGFGRCPGDVQFIAKGSMNPGPRGTVTEWQDDRICVTIPDGAGCGLVVRLPLDAVRVCDRFIDVRPHGRIEAVFEGTSAEILKFQVKDRIDEQCLQPGDLLRIRWKTCAADRVRIEIVNETTGQVIAFRDPADASGAWDFADTNFNRTTRLTVRITAFGACTPPSVSREFTFTFQKPANLQIDGIEVTQAIQHYRAAQHLTDPADRGPDNSLRLVTDKAAWVRVYLRSGQDPAFDNGEVPDVSGLLTLERRVNGVWGVVMQTGPQNAPVTARDSFATYDAERGDISTTLNFVVPASQMSGLLRFRVSVSSPFVVCGDGEDQGQRSINVNLTKRLNAAFIRVGYNGPDNAGTGTLNLPAPTLTDCVAETAWAMRTYPVSSPANVRSAGSFTTSTPLNDPRSCPGCCSPNWGPLLSQIALVAALDQIFGPGGDWVYYGIIAGGIPVTVPGCNGVASGGLAGQPITYAHEIGHQFGLPHAPCGGVGTPNAAYPAYEPYDLPPDPPGTTNFTTASIGEYGLDIDSGAIASPATAEDFMSYCGPRWISRHTYLYLLNRPELTTQIIPTGDAGAPRMIEDDPTDGLLDEPGEPHPVVHMLGEVDADGVVSVQSVVRVSTRRAGRSGRPTALRAQLVDESGAVIAEDTLEAFESDACGHRDAGGDGSCGCKEGPKRGFAFRAMPRDVASGQALRIVKEGDTVWERKAPAKPPTVSRVRASLDKSGQLALSWEARTATDEPAEIAVRWSTDNGETWGALATGLSGKSAVVDVEGVPAGEVVFQVLVSDGFSTASAVSGGVALPERPPSAAILYPREGDRAFDDRQIHLRGDAVGAISYPVPEEEFEWRMEGKRVGSGRDLWVDSPGEGTHEIELRVRDAVARSKVTIR